MIFNKNRILHVVPSLHEKFYSVGVRGYETMDKSLLTESFHDLDFT